MKTYDFTVGGGVVGGENHIHALMNYEFASFLIYFKSSCIVVHLLFYYQNGLNPILMLQCHPEITDTFWIITYLGRYLTSIFFKVFVMTCRRSDTFTSTSNFSWITHLLQLIVSNFHMKYQAKHVAVTELDS